MAHRCVGEVKAASGVSSKEAEAILNELDGRYKTRSPEEKLDRLESGLMNEADDMVTKMRESAIIDKRNQLINISRKKSIYDFVGRFEDPADGVQALMVGTNRPVKGARLSVDARTHAIQQDYFGNLVADLKRENLLEVARSGKLDREIARELWEYRPKGKRGISGSKEAENIAAMIYKQPKKAMSRLNRSGGWIKSLQGYVVRQSHNMGRIRRAGFDQWADFVLPRLDQFKTFKGMKGAEPDQYLKQIYDDLVTGKHLRAHGVDEDFILTRPGEADLAKKVSESRHIHFKDSDSFMDYNQKFGSQNLMEAAISGLDHSARNTALMEAFGPSPRAMFDRVRAELKDLYRGDVKKYDRLARKRLDYQFAELDGSTKIPASNLGAKIGNGIRSTQNMAKLGLATLSSVADIAQLGAEMRYQGVNLLGAYLKAFQNILKGRRKGQSREIAELIGVGMDGMRGQVFARFSATDDLPGVMNKLQQSFFKLSLLNWWTDAHKTGAGLMMARRLAQMKSKVWDQLDVDLKRTLSLYDIDHAKWDLIRLAGAREADGRTYIIPENIRDISDSTISKHLKSKSNRAITKFRDELETSLRSYILDRADFAVPTPGARESAIMRQGLQPGTVLGEAARFVGQFKSFPTTVLTKTLGREIYGKGKADILGLVHIAIGTTVMGYLAMCAKDIVKGRTPRDANDPKTWVAAMVQGGGAGLLGDFLFNDFNRFGHGLWSTALGPTAGAAEDLADIYSRIKRGDDASAQAFRLTLNNTPFINLFYTRAALDYLFLYNVQEMLNPGYLRRMERRADERGQKFILPPSKHAFR